MRSVCPPFSFYFFEYFLYYILQRFIYYAACSIVTFVNYEGVRVATKLSLQEASL